MASNQPGSWASPLSPSRANPVSGVAYIFIIAIEAGQPIEQARMLFWTCPYLDFLQKKKTKHGDINTPKLK